MLRKSAAGAKGLIRVEGYSSVGRASVSKTEGRGFESLCPCHACIYSESCLERGASQHQGPNQAGLSGSGAV